ncbi:hypothetical protein ACHWQZ_G002085 [Mnemiopsis leidyi]
MHVPDLHPAENTLDVHDTLVKLNSSYEPASDVTTPNNDNGGYASSAITFKYITLDLLKRAANSHKKVSLSTLMTSLGLKDSNNVTVNKAKLCNFLDTCADKGIVGTEKVIPHLLNKIDDTTIKLELLANDLIPLGPSAHDRKKDLIKFCLDQCVNKLGPTKLVFDFGQTNTSHLDTSHSDTSHLDPKQPTKTKTSPPTSCKKNYKKKSKGSDPCSQPEPPSHSQCTDEGLTQDTSTTSPSQRDYKEDQIDQNMENTKFHESRSCDGCSELKESMSVLQDSLLVLKEEMLQQKAITDLIISTPNPSDKAMTTLLNKKLGPMDAKLNQLKIDLDLLRMTVDQQNNSLETVMNKIKMPEVPKASHEQLRRNFADLLTANLSNKDRIVTLEIGQDNLTRAIRSLPSQFSLATSHNAKSHRETAIPSLITRQETLAQDQEEANANPLENGRIESNNGSGQPNRDSNPSTRDLNPEAGKDPNTPNRVSNSSINSDLNPITRVPASTNRVSNSLSRNFNSPQRESYFPNGGSYSSNRNPNSPNRDSNPSNRESDSPNRDSGASIRDSPNRDSFNGDSPNRNVSNLPNGGLNSSNREPNPSNRFSNPSNNSSNNPSGHSDTSYRRHTVLLIHDEHFKDFDKKLFNKRFNVHLFPANSFSALEQKSNQLNAVIRRIRPECIYIHTGMNDFIKKKSGLVNYVEDLAELLLKKTEAQIGFSLLIPSNNSELNAKIKVVNDEIKHFVTWLLSISSRAKGRLFTCRNSLRMLCWNINHARDKYEGAKVDIPEINELFDSQDFILLQETKEPVTMRNFCCFNTNRKNTKSGGVFIGVHKSLKPGIARVDTGTCEDIVIVKLKSDFFGLDKDLNLVNVYDSPKYGSFKKRKRAEEAEDHLSTIEKLQEILAEIPHTENIALFGDFNARTGAINDSLQNHHFCNEPHIPIDLDNLPIRCNKDKKLNQNGRPFIELLQTFGLRILNGRTLGDIFGEPTCIQRHGVSTVDYVCLPNCLYQRVNYFKVGRQNLFSDHRPLHFSLQTRSAVSVQSSAKHLLGSFPDAPKPYKWVRSETPNLDTSFLFMSAQNKEVFINKANELQNILVSSKEGVHELNERVISLYRELADSTTIQKAGKRTNKRKWYDWSCRLAKREANRAQRTVDSHPDDPSLRTLLVQKRKEYRKVKRRKKNRYLYEMNDKINNGGKLDWNAFKNLSEQYTDEDSFDIYDLISFHSFFNNLYNRGCNKGQHAATNNNGNDAFSELDNDLVLLALDAASLQKLLDCLNIYAEQWELSVNLGKTNVMVFNKSSRILNCAYGFKLGTQELFPETLWRQLTSES